MTPDEMAERIQATLLAVVMAYKRRFKVTQDQALRATLGDLQAFLETKLAAYR